MQSLFFSSFFLLFEEVRAGTRGEIGNPRDSPGVDTDEQNIERVDTDK